MHLRRWSFAYRSTAPVPRSIPMLRLYLELFDTSFSIDTFSILILSLAKFTYLSCVFFVAPSSLVTQVAVAQQTKALAIHEQLGGFDTPDGNEKETRKRERERRVRKDRRGLKF